MLDIIIIAGIAIIFIGAMTWALWERQEKVELPTIDLDAISNPILPHINPDDFADPQA